MTKTCLILAAVSFAGLMAGCKEKIRPTAEAPIVTRMDNVSPKTLAVSMHQAIYSQNYEGIEQCIAPSYRSGFHNILGAWQKYAAKMNQTADLVDKRVDPEVAGELRAELDHMFHELIPSPLEGAMKDGKVNWEQTSVDMKDDSHAIIMVNGHFTDFSGKFLLVQTAGGWYAAPMEDPETFAADAKKMLRAYKEITSQLDGIQGQIKKGKVNRQNVRQAFWKTGLPASGPRR